MQNAHLFENMVCLLEHGNEISECVKKTIK